MRRALADLAPLLVWRNPEHYAYVAKLENTSLAWEFLRRNPEYRADVGSWLPQWLALDKVGCEKLELWEPVEAKMERLCEKWKLWPVFGLGIPNSRRPPNFKNLQVPLGPDIVGWSINGEIEDYSSSLGDYGPAVTLRIHLNQPVSEQLKATKKIIESVAEAYGVKPPRLCHKDVRRQDRKYPLYLQILDARLEGASLAVIAKALYGPDREAYEAARDDTRTAVGLAQGGYLGLCRLPPRRGKQ